MVRVVFLFAVAAAACLPGGGRPRPGISGTGTRDSLTPRVVAFVPQGSVTHDVVPLAQVTRMEVSDGRSDQLWTGALVGGALTSAAFVGMACSMNSGSCGVTSDNVVGILRYVGVGGGSWRARRPVGRRTHPRRRTVARGLARALTPNVAPGRLESQA